MTTTIRIEALATSNAKKFRRAYAVAGVGKCRIASSEAGENDNVVVYLTVEGVEERKAVLAMLEADHANVACYCCV
jgi:hypothetical protein